MSKAPVPPPAHVSGQTVPDFARSSLPRHVAIVMDGNGRWANARGLKRTEGHRAGEAALMDVIAGAVEAGVEVLSVYAFSTENWKRSPAEVKFLMTYSRDVIARRRDELDSWGVRIVWSGRPIRIWKSVNREFEKAVEQTKHNTGTVLNFCFNYGGQAEIADAAGKIARLAAAGKLDPETVTAQTVARYLYHPQLPPVDLFIRSGGERRISNFLLWQASYAELLFLDLPWPEADRLTLWDCLLWFGGRERRFGTAVDRISPAY